MTSHFDIRCGHVLDVLADIESESVDCCVTSPPYWGLRDYGTEPQIWGGNTACEHEWGDRRTVRDVREETISGKTRTTERFYGDESRRFNGNHQKITDGQFCLNCGAWYGSLGLEPTTELYVDHLTTVLGEVRRVLKEDGTLWLNLGDSYCSTAPGTWGDPLRQEGIPAGVKDQTAIARRSFRQATPSGLKPKDLIGIPWRVAFALQADGWYLRSDIIWNKPNPMPESVTDRPTKAHEYIFLLAKAERYYFDAEAIKEPQSGNERTRRLREQKNGLDSVYSLQRDQPHGQVAPGQTGAARSVRRRQELAVVGTRNKRSVWTLATLPTPEAHFATFTIELAETCILAGCRPLTGVVLDPFSGAATTGLAALKQGRNYLGIELNPTYIEISYQRARKYYPLLLNGAEEPEALAV